MQIIQVITVKLSEYDTCLCHPHHIITTLICLGQNILGFNEDNLLKYYFISFWLIAITFIMYAIDVHPCPSRVGFRHVELQ